MIRCATNGIEEHHLAKKQKTARVVRVPFTKDDLKMLKQHSKAKTPVTDIAKLMKRTEGSVRQKAMKLGLGLGHRR